MHPKHAKDWKFPHQKAIISFLVSLAKSPLATDLIFKGGTALFVFYGLPRFSVDLDFDFHGALSREKTQTYLADHITRYFPLWKIENDSPESTQVVRFFIDYGGHRKLKIEITWPVCPGKGEPKTLLGSPLFVMRSEDMFAHKLIALYSRYEKNESLANRDLYDIDFFFSRNISPNPSIILCRTSRMQIGEMGLGKYLLFLSGFLKKSKTAIEKNILSGIGDLVDETEKKRVEKELFGSVIEQMDIMAHVLG